MIEVKNIIKTYVNGDNETHALRGVSFTIKDGEFVAIMGPSGSGKSTLMHILGALDTPTSGTYLLDGHDVSKLSDDELADYPPEQHRLRLPVLQSPAPRHRHAQRHFASHLCRVPEAEREKARQEVVEIAGLG